MATIKMCDRCGAMGDGNAIGIVLLKDRAVGNDETETAEICPDCVKSLHGWLDQPEHGPKATNDRRALPFDQPYRGPDAIPPDAVSLGLPQCKARTRHQGLPIQCTLADNHLDPVPAGVNYSVIHFESRSRHRWE